MKNLFGLLLAFQIIATPPEDKVSIETLTKNTLVDLEDEETTSEKQLAQNAVNVKITPAEDNVELSKNLLLYFAKRADEHYKKNKNSQFITNFKTELEFFVSSNNNVFSFIQNLINIRESIVKQQDYEFEDIVKKQDNELFIFFIKKLHQSLYGKIINLPSPLLYKSFKATVVLLLNNPEIQIESPKNAHSKLERQCIKTLEKDPKNKFAQLPSIALRLIHEFVPEYDVYEWEMYNNLYKMRQIKFSTNNKEFDIVRQKVLISLHNIIYYIYDKNPHNFYEKLTPLMSAYYVKTNEYIKNSINLFILSSISFLDTDTILKENGLQRELISTYISECWKTDNPFWILDHWIKIANIYK